MSLNNPQKTYRDHSATGPEAGLPVWDHNVDHARVTQVLYRHERPEDLVVALAGFITSVSLQAAENGFHDGHCADTSAGIARAARARTRAGEEVALTGSAR